MDLLCMFFKTGQYPKIATNRDFLVQKNGHSFNVHFQWDYSNF